METNVDPVSLVCGAVALIFGTRLSSNGMNE